MHAWTIVAGPEVGGEEFEEFLLPRQMHSERNLRKSFQEEQAVIWSDYEAPALQERRTRAGRRRAFVSRALWVSVWLFGVTVYEYCKHK